VANELVRAAHVSRAFRTAYEEVVAVKDASCAVRARERIGLFGPSGSGKSTLLQLLGGLDVPSAGSIEWPGLSERAQLRPRHVAFVFQNQTLLAALSAVENVEVPLLLQGSAAEPARAAAQAALDRIGLGDLAEKLPEELSGGQAQRVAFARALAGNPDLILADEPTGQLDRQTAHHLFEIVLPWIEEIGGAIVIATHDRAIEELVHAKWTMRFGVLDAPA
jgi:putative ABC transport system ATP-binding protein/lipoprotein-releasing system ATP-binding protein